MSAVFLRLVMALVLCWHVWLLLLVAFAINLAVGVEEQRLLPLWLLLAGFTWVFVFPGSR